MAHFYDTLQHNLNFIRYYLDFPNHYLFKKLLTIIYPSYTSISFL